MLGSTNIWSNCKTSKFSSKNICSHCEIPCQTAKVLMYHPNSWTRCGFTIDLCHKKMQREMKYSADPDETALAGAVSSGSALFAQAYLFKNLGSLQ